MSTMFSSLATQATPIYMSSHWEETRGDPGHTGEITSLGWPWSTSESSQKGWKKCPGRWSLGFLDVHVASMIQYRISRWGQDSYEILMIKCSISSYLQILDLGLLGAPPLVSHLRNGKIEWSSSSWFLTLKVKGLSELSLTTDSIVCIFLKPKQGGFSLDTGFGH